MPTGKITLESIMDRIRQNLSNAEKNSHKADKVYSIKEFSNDIVQMRIENEQINQKWNVETEFHITSHRKIIGKLIVFGKKVMRKFLRWYINPIINKQQSFNISATKNLNAISKLIQGLLDERNELVIRIQEMERLFANQEGRLHKVEVLTNEAVKKLEELSTEYNIDKNRNVQEMQMQGDEVFNHIAAIKQKLNADSLYISELNQKVNELESLVIFTNDRLRRWRRQATNKQDNFLNEQLVATTSQSSVLTEAEEFDYLLFEQKFRGSREQIIKRQREYLNYFQQSKRVLDIGCGRGEFIELLLQQGINAQGIDINEEMVEYCQERGFEVSNIDANQFLSNITEPTYDAIIMAQVIEHLTFNEYSYLLKQIHRVLRPGGFVIIETINVQSVYAMNNWFYMDPTHTKPVHPETLKFVVENIGFNKVEKKLLSPVSHTSFPRLSVDVENIEQFNEHLQELSNLIYGFQDYAIIAYK